VAFPKVIGPFVSPVAKDPSLLIAVVNICSWKGVDNSVRSSSR
jgi:hypothetical protein